MLTAAAPDLIVHSASPFNAEPPLRKLRASFITPSALFYIRSHGTIPAIEAGTYRLRVHGRVATPLELSLDELRARFPARRETAVLQCAGNRRADLQVVRPTAGDPWAPGAIGNATWEGVALADLLRAAGVEASASLHVAFAGADEVAEGGPPFHFGASIPIAKAMSPEVLLACRMNGAPLAPAHGHPLRVVVPGYAGVRSVKWLSEIEVRDSPSDNHFQQEDYRLFPPDVDGTDVDWASGMVIDALPVNAAICEPARGARLPPGRVEMRGYAIASARSIARVDVSVDGGRHWRRAALTRDPGAPWAWTFWEAAFDLGPGEHELAVRAWDEAGQTQPALPDDMWNFKGYLSAAWHRVRIVVAEGMS